MTSACPGTIIVKLAKTVSDLKPAVDILYEDELLTLQGYYNKRGYCIGYSLSFIEEPKVVIKDFYTVVNYSESIDIIDTCSLIKIPKKDSKICFIRHGSKLNNRIYTLIYRKKRDG